MKPTAATYARVSLDEQKENYSPDSQQGACDKLAADKGYTVPEEFRFVDAGFLGGEADRPALNALLEAVRSGLIGAVFVYDLDRLCRGLALQLWLTEQLEKHGVALMFVTAPDPATTPEARMFLQIRGAFSEYEKHKFRERATRGRKEKARQGWWSGQIPYGYIYKGQKQGSKGELVIHRERAEVYEKMCSLALQGCTMLQICRKLNAEGIKPVRAKQWTKPVVARILANPAYTGQAIYNKSCRSEPKARRKPAEAGKSKKTSARKRPESEWITLSVPAIISPERWQSVREAIERTTQLNRGRPAARQHLLRGLLRCSRCGTACCVVPNHGRPRYKCNNIDRTTYRRLCSAPTMAVDKLEETVWYHVERLCTEPGALELAQAEMQKAAAGNDKATARERARLEQLIARLQQQERLAAKHMTDPELAESHGTFRQQLMDAQNRRRTAEAQLRALAPAKQPQPRVEHSLLERWFRNTLKAGGKRAVLTAVVNRIDVGDGEVLIDTGFPGIILSSETDTNRFNQQSAPRTRCGPPPRSCLASRAWRRQRTHSSPTDY